MRLQRAQQVERRYLAAAFTRVGDLERRRAAGQAAALAAFVRIYRTAVVPMQQIAGELSCGGRCCCGAALQCCGSTNKLSWASLACPLLQTRCRSCWGK